MPRGARCATVATLLPEGARLLDATDATDAADATHAADQLRALPRA
ncbi:hypothetical protein [Streptomyces sp. NPDC058335]